LFPVANEDVGRLEDELARKLRFSLMQRTYMEPWKVPEACEVVILDKRVEHNNEGQCSPAERDIKESSQLRKEVG
jgi:hypothetical protein